MGTAIWTDGGIFCCSCSGPGGAVRAPRHPPDGGPPVLLQVPPVSSPAPLLDSENCSVRISTRCVDWFPQRSFMAVTDATLVVVVVEGCWY